MRAPAAFDSVVLAAVTHDLRGWIGARVRRVTQPSAHEIALDLRGRGSATVLISVDARWARIHLAGAAPAGELFSFAQMLRARLEGARLLAVDQPPFERSVRLRCESDTGPRDLVAEIMGRHSNLLLVEDGVIAGALKLVHRAQSSVREVLPGRPFVPPPRDRPAPTDLDLDRLRTLLSGLQAPLAQALSSHLLGLSPVMARELAVRAELDPDQPAAEQAHSAEALYRVVGELIVLVREEAFQPVVYLDDDVAVGYAPFPLQHLSSLPHVPAATMSEAVARVIGTSSRSAELEEQRRTLSTVVRAALAKVERVEADLDHALQEAADGGVLRARGDLLLAYASQIQPGSTEATLPGFDGMPVTVPLDPHLTPIENAQQLFSRYAKVRAARPQLAARRRAVEEEGQYLESTLAMVEAAADLDDLAVLRRELVEERYLRRGRERRPAPPPKPRTFRLEGGATIVAGRSNQDNERVTFKVAGPDDLWFHTRGIPGAHVVLRTGGVPPNEAQIQAAAEAAAYFSRARAAGRVAVDYTARRYVRKPRGSRPGLVVITRERTVQAVPRLPAD